MGRYVHKFITNSEYESFTNGESYIEPFVSYTVEKDEVDYNPEHAKFIPLTFKIISAGNIVWQLNNAQGTAKTIEYKKNNSEWTSITSTTEGVNIPVVKNDIVQFRGDNTAYCDNESKCNTFSTSTCQFIVYGNIMSLISSTNFGQLKRLSTGHTFRKLFYNCSGLVGAENLILPATNISASCYAYMFYATNITITPKLPAPRVESNCYEGMFKNCINLTTISDFSATGTTSVSYSGCRYMFKGCTNLVNIQNMTLNASLNWAFGSMFEGCISLIDASPITLTDCSDYSYSNMFKDCTSLTTSPTIAAIDTISANCCYLMFDGCTNLNYIKALFINIGSGNPLSSWVRDVSPTGTFVKNTNANWDVVGTNGVPSGWTIEYASE